MPKLRQLFALAALLTSTAFSGGCNTIASTLGFSPPVHELIEPAAQFRMAAVNPAPLPKELSKVSLAAYVVEPGDTLSVEPTRFDSRLNLSGVQEVLQDGTIDLGQYGRPVVAWKTVPQIEAEIRPMVTAYALNDELTMPKDDQRPADEVRSDSKVTVRLVGRESKVFYVLGEVNAPRAYPLAGRETVLDGLLTAGGLTRQADAKKVIVSRPTPPNGCRVILPVCYNQIVQLGDTSTNYQLQPGDRIYVPSQAPIQDFLDKIHNRNKPCGPCLAGQYPCATGTAGCIDGNCAPRRAGLRSRGLDAGPGYLSHARVADPAECAEGVQPELTRPLDSPTPAGHRVRRGRFVPSLSKHSICVRYRHDDDPTHGQRHPARSRRRHHPRRPAA